MRQPRIGQVVQRTAQPLTTANIGSAGLWGPLSHTALWNCLIRPRHGRPGREKNRFVQPLILGVHIASSNSLWYRATPETFFIAESSNANTMNASSGTPSHWLVSPYFEARWNPKRG